jgi:hypothetical protein
MVSTVRSLRFSVNADGAQTRAFFFAWPTDVRVILTGVADLYPRGLPPAELAALRAEFHSIVADALGDYFPDRYGDQGSEIPEWAPPLLWVSVQYRFKLLILIDSQYVTAFYESSGAGTRA